MAITDEQIETFVAAVEEKRRAWDEVSGYTRDSEITYTRGPRYARIIVQGLEGMASHRSVFCFVRLEDGAILKAAGWNAPAKGVRGNISNGAAQVTPYGAAYNR